MFLVLGIVILVASFSIVGNLIMVVVEKAREIALLKTLGATRRRRDAAVRDPGPDDRPDRHRARRRRPASLGCWAGKRFGLPLNPDVYYIDRLPIHVDPASVLAAAARGRPDQHRRHALPGDGRRARAACCGNASLSVRGIGVTATW